MSCDTTAAKSRLATPTHPKHPLSSHTASQSRPQPRHRQCCTFGRHAHGASHRFDASRGHLVLFGRGLVFSGVHLSQCVQSRFAQVSCATSTPQSPQHICYPIRCNFPTHHRKQWSTNTKHTIPLVLARVHRPLPHLPTSNRLPHTLIARTVSNYRECQSSRQQCQPPHRCLLTRHRLHHQSKARQQFAPFHPFVFTIPVQ